MTRKQDILKQRAEEYAEQTGHGITWNGDAWQLGHINDRGLPVFGDTPGEACCYLRGYQNGTRAAKKRIAEMVVNLADGEGGKP